MDEHDPEYVRSKFSYNRKVATKCRICGHQLLTPEEMNLEMHEICKDNYEPNVKVMG